MNILSTFVQALPEAGPDLLEAAGRATTPHEVEVIFRRVTTGWTLPEIAAAALTPVNHHPNPTPTHPQQR